MFLVTSVTSVIGMKYLYVDRAKNFFSKMLQFRHQGYQMKALLKVDEEYQHLRHLKYHLRDEIAQNSQCYKLEMTHFLAFCYKCSLCHKCKWV